MAPRKPKNGPRNWQANAEEFAALDKGEGWAFAIRVACSVERAQPGSKPQDRSEHADLEKVSASAFARKAHTTKDRVLRYLDAWQEAHEEGLVPSADKLNPNDVTDIAEPDVPWHNRPRGHYVSPEPPEPDLAPAAQPAVPKQRDESPAKPAVKQADSAPSKIEPMVPADVPLDIAASPVTLSAVPDLTEAEQREAGKITLVMIDEWMSYTQDLVNKLTEDERQILVEQLESIIDQIRKTV